MYLSPGCAAAPRPPVPAASPAIFANQVLGEAYLPGVRGQYGSFRQEVLRLFFQVLFLFNNRAGVFQGELLQFVHAQPDGFLGFDNGFRRRSSRGRFLFFPD